MEDLLPLLALLLISAISTWLQKRRQGDAEEEEAAEAPPGSTGKTAPGDAQTRRQSLEDRFRDWLDLEKEDEARPQQSSSPPVLTEEPAQRSQEQAGSAASPSASTEQPTTVAGRSRQSSEWDRLSEEERRRVQEQAKAFEQKSGRGAYKRPHHTPYRRETGAYDVEGRPYAQKQPRAQRRAAIASRLRSPRSVREIFIGSLLLSPPKSLDEQTSHYF